MSKPGKGIWALLALALLLRLALLAAVPDPGLAGDPADYDRHARSIASGDGYPESVVAPDGGPTAIRPPGYPYFLALLYVITGGGADAARLAQAFVGTANAALIGLLGWRLWDRRVGIAALAVASVFPPLIIAGSALYTESLFVALMLGALLAALQYRASGTKRWAAAAGALLGLGVLTRENGLVLLVPLVIAVWDRVPRLSLQGLAPPALLLAVAALVVLPWTVRNAVVMDAFVPVTTTAGYTLAGTYNDAARTDSSHPGVWRPANRDPEYARLLRKDPGSEVEAGARLVGAVADYVREHPGYVLGVAYRNTRTLLHLDGFESGRLGVTAGYGLPTRVADVAILGFYGLAALAIFGALTRRAREAPRFVWLAPILLFLSVVFVRGAIRFRIPIDPFLILLGAVAVVVLWTVAERRLTSRRGVPSG